MRYDNRTTIVRILDGVYNPDTGKQKSVRTVFYDNIPCNVNPLSPARAQASFGNIYQDVTVIRLQRSNKEDLTRATHAYVDGRAYKIVKVVEYRHDIAIYANEVK
ncbi:head-tail adaptor protein [Staphylococcus chromogenes]|uniref:head-tail adaptor protein n=1 Tax=Staphylococcus chromogenes TaxID=46126 RepID=UPI00189057F9|nr:head-tail adaptor protein [Staphylococcus chromogenes]